jgi:beta-1,4-mannosyl-glycoprotein beta-1,4-N-acetylglucosaminyltransferase
MLVDYFPYFIERELLELRIRLLQDHVDHFVICEADKTHTGLPRKFQVKDLIAELSLPSERITVIELNHEDDVNLQMERQDFDAQFAEDRGDIDSIQAVARDRHQRNGLLKVLNQFDDDDWIIMSDCDEIINPDHIGFALNVAQGNPAAIIKLPLINLYGRADLRPYSTTGWPFTWRTAMSICRKSLIAQTAPHRIRCGYHVPFEILTPTLDGKIFDEFGWHFSWMGGDSRITTKSRSYAHWPNRGHQAHIQKGIQFKAGASLTWDPDSILQPFPLDQLPQLIFDLPHIREFLLPD